jgi:hypothetical protein
MRLISGNKLVAFVFDDANDIDVMLAELARMRAAVDDGSVDLPASFVGMDENATDADRDEFTKILKQVGNN